VSWLYRPTPVPFKPHEPSWRQPLRLHFDPLFRGIKPVLASLRGRVLDIGCGMQPYRSLLDASLTEYVGVDRKGPLSNPTVEGTAEALPFPDASFDAALSTQVLEHLLDPQLAINEALRVLKPGGTLVLTVPGLWPLHEAPHDYWRFTRYGVLALLDRSPYTTRDRTLRQLGGYWAGVGQLVNLELQRARYARELVPFVNLAFEWLDRRGSAEELPLAWLATATRAP
jgi:SAM-dependent methyltransferase